MGPQLQGDDLGLRSGMASCTPPKQFADLQKQGSFVNMDKHGGDAPPDATTDALVAEQSVASAPTSP